MGLSLEVVTPVVEIPGLHCEVLWRSRWIGSRRLKQRRKEAKEGNWDERSVWML